MGLALRIRERIRRRLLTQKEGEEILEGVNAIEYIPEDKKANVYVRGIKHVFEHVLSVEWMPPWSPETSSEKLPVVLFHADTLHIDIHFDPYVKIKYDPDWMTITILWSPTA